MNINFKSILTISVVLISSNLFGQNYFSRHFDFEGDNDIAWNITKVGDRYVVYSANFCHQNTVGCTGLLCFNKNLDLIWRIQLDSVGPLFEESVTTDNQFIYLCVTPEYNPNYVMRLYKIDINGNLVQMKELGPYNKVISPFVMNYHNDLLYMNVLFWHDRRVKGYDSTEIWYMDKNFEVVHKFTDTDKNKYEDLTGYRSTADGNFIASKTFYGSDGIVRGMVKKFDPSGKNIQKFYLPWTHNGYYTLGLEHVKPTRDNGWVGLWHQEIEVLYSDTFPMQPMVYKMDSLGNVEWVHTFYSKHPKRITNLFEATNGDIILVGEKESSGRVNKYVLSGWVVRIASDGKILWEKSYNDTISDNGFSHFYDGLELDNGDLVFCGSIVPKREFGIFNTDNWLVHTDRNGCILPSCDSFQLLTKIDFPKEQPFAEVRFTNPVENELVVESDSFSSPVSITITDLKSSKILEFKEMLLPLKCNVSQVPAGIYLLKIQDMRTHISKTYKFLKT